jgi:lipopolysaccharide/colanic/teichoic acid biosynthesis glycosyltransferase
VREDGAWNRLDGSISNSRERAARVFDLVCLALLVPATIPIAAMLALAIKLDSPGPVLYRSRRIGRGGTPFDMLKFRKMRGGSTGPLLTSSKDERFTPIGRFLMLTKLDELPQIWNVARGDMRLVGPRPEVPEFVAHYQDSYDEILSIPPGITGVSQLIYASESRTLDGVADPVGHYENELLPTKIKLDIGYVRHRSMGRDLALLARTAVLPARRLAATARIMSLALRRVEFSLAVLAIVTLLITFAWASRR